MGNGIAFRSTNIILRRVAIGSLAGSVCGFLLAHTFDYSFVGFGLGVAVGIAFALAMGARTQTYLDSMMTAASFGVPVWAAINIIALPMLAYESPGWTAEAMRAQFPALVGWTLYGLALGALVKVLNDVASRMFGAARAPAAPPREVTTRIVILGGGFAGVTCAENLEAAFGADAAVETTLVSDTNALLFTPMLAEVAASSLEGTHISTPLRTTLKRTNVVRGRVEGVDLKTCRVRLAADARVPSRTSRYVHGTNGDGEPGERRELKFDHLVLALGSVSNYLGMESVAANSFDFKSRSRTRYAYATTS